ncbi:MAG: hypothetical protein IMW90_02650 [Thermogemmatispora sp.]|uniref:variant leucine-rich repeat-containing protein n=1 Tax=Thermogemmatispora sp. TaxID=1968838 RepID=UPI0019FEA0F2|nr:hypothetical protein [Thermogemmatispora sp.]MBE3564608.1 hypothetical protein [Thermogemmatispora sp.]
MTTENVPPELIAEAQNLDTPPERLSELSHQPALRPLVAANPATPPVVLEQLSRERDLTVRRAVARNPNTSLDLLLELAREFPHEFLANPILPLLNLTQPDFIKQASPQAWLQLLRCEETPLLWLRWLNEDVNLSRIRWFSDETMWALQWHVAIAGEISEFNEQRQRFVSEAVADYERRSSQVGLYPRSFSSTLVLLTLAIPDLYPELVEGIYSPDDECWRRLLLACYPYLHQETVLKLVSEGPLAVRAEAVRLLPLPPELLYELARAPEVEIRSAVAANPATPPTLLLTLTEDASSQVRSTAARHPQLPAERLAHLARSSEPEVRRAVAGHTALGAIERELLATDASVEVRAAVAPHLPPESAFLRRLAEDEASQVRAAVASHSALPTALSASLARDSALEVVLSLAGNPCLPPKLAEQLCAHSQAMVRWRIASHPALAPETLRHLASSHRQDRSLLAGLARNPNTPADVLTWLAELDDREIHLALSQQPELPAPLLERLAARYLSEWRRQRAVVSTDEGTQPIEILRSLAAHPSSPLTLLEQLLRLNDSEVAIAVATHPRTITQGQSLIFDYLLETLREEIIKADLPSRLRPLLLQRRDLPPALLELFAESGRWVERYLVAQHAAVPSTLLETLAHDGNCFVRAAARARLASQSRD